jgi:hypothetical protein
MNAALREVVLGMRREDPAGGLVSNIGGWQSRKFSAHNEHLLSEMGRRPGVHGWAVRRLQLHILQQLRVSRAFHLGVGPY